MASLTACMYVLNREGQFIASTVDMHYFYPEKPDGLKGEKLQVARPDSIEEQWIL